MRAEFVPMVEEMDLLEMLRTFEPLFAPDVNIETKLEKTPTGWQLHVGGFYKHDHVLITRNEDRLGYSKQFNVGGRYGPLDSVNTFDDLVALNFWEWRIYEDRGFSVSDSWLPFLIANGHVISETKITTTYKPAGA